MEKDGRLYFHERVLRGGVDDRCFWENFDDIEKRRIYRVVGYFPQGKEDKDRIKFSIIYLEDFQFFYIHSKTLEEVAYDLDARPKELINLGKKLRV